MRLMRNFGFVDFDEVVYDGTNGKMTEVYRGHGTRQPRFDGASFRSARNLDNHSAYSNVFERSELVRLRHYEPSVKGNHQYVVVELAPSASMHRDRLVADLHAENVLAARKYSLAGM